MLSCNACRLHSVDRNWYVSSKAKIQMQRNTHTWSPLHVPLCANRACVNATISSGNSFVRSSESSVSACTFMLHPQRSLSRGAQCIYIVYSCMNLWPIRWPNQIWWQYVSGRFRNMRTVGVKAYQTTRCIFKWFVNVMIQQNVNSLGFRFPAHRVDGFGHP